MLVDVHPPLEGEGRLAWSAAKCETGWGYLSTRVLFETRDLHPTPPLLSVASTLPLQGCSDRGQGGRVFGDIVDTFDSESRRLSDAVPRRIPDGREIGICDVGVGGRSQCAEPVPSLRRQPDERLQVAGALAARRNGWTSGVVASAAEFAVAQRCSDGASRAFGACGASGLGRPQDRQAAEGSGARSSSGALDGDGDLEAAWGRTGRARWRPVRLHPVRAGAAERVVADGLQGPRGLARWPASSADRARRSLALRRGACGLRQRADRDGPA